MTSIWKQQGATLSDKSARKEFGLTQDEIFAAMRAGKLQFRQNSMHGNPWFRLLRHEVEALVKEKSGKDGLKKETRKGTVGSQKGSQEDQDTLESYRKAAGGVGERAWWVMAVQ